MENPLDELGSYVQGQNIESFVSKLSCCEIHTTYGLPDSWEWLHKIVAIKLVSLQGSTWSATRVWNVVEDLAG